MSAETSTETVSTSTEETSGQEVNNSTDASTEATSETEANGTEQTSTQQDDRLPDDHPLVKALAAQKDELKQLKASSSTKVQELEAKISELSGQTTSADAIQAKFDRLEAFLSNVGGPLSKALDSRSFTSALFESDTDVADLVTKWHRDNPSATSSALNSSSGTNQSSKSMNDLLRQAAR